MYPSKSELTAEALLPYQHALERSTRLVRLQILNLQVNHGIALLQLSCQEDLQGGSGVFNNLLRRARSALQTKVSCMTSQNSLFDIHLWPSCAVACHCGLNYALHGFSRLLQEGFMMPLCKACCALSYSIKLQMQRLVALGHPQGAVEIADHMAWLLVYEGQKHLPAAGSSQYSPLTVALVVSVGITAAALLLNAEVEQGEQALGPITIPRIKSLNIGAATVPLVQAAAIGLAVLGLVTGATCLSIIWTVSMDARYLSCYKSGSSCEHLTINASRNACCSRLGLCNLLAFALCLQRSFESQSIHIPSDLKRSVCAQGRAFLRERLVKAPIVQQ